MKTYKIQNRLDDILNNQQEERSSRPRSGCFSPSSLGRCFRAQIFNRLNVPQTNLPDSRALRIFQAGHLFHDFVQNLVKSDNITVEMEVDCGDIHGFADYVDEDCVLDFKSQHSRAFWHMAKSDYDIKTKKLSNWLQVACYAHILKKKYCGLVFISKDDLCISEYIFEAKEFFKELNVEFKVLRKYWSEKVLPEPQPRAYDGKECQYCGWKERCKELGKEGIPFDFINPKNNLR